MAATPAHGASHGEPIPPKKSLFDDEISSSDDDQEDGGAALGSSTELKVNEEYARRFEHNKKREELHRLEEKYKSSGKPNGATAEGGLGSDSDSSSDETEDDEGFLITEDLDAEISATLQAIKKKDPRIYDKSAVFYKPVESEDASAKSAAQDKKEKPVFLRDYHRERYMRGDVGVDAEDEPDADQPMSYAQEQQDIKKALISEINAAAAAEDEEWSGDEAFMKPKAQPQLNKEGIHPARAPALKLTEDDVANAEKDPEAYLNKFMASKAWAAGAKARWDAFDSDEGEDDGNDLAEEFEHAYNMRFEDPEKSNEVLKSYSRNAATAYSARKEELTGRKKQRKLEKERKEAEKREREEERRRLRRLKLEEAQEKLQKIKEAAGMSGKTLRDEDWMKFLDDAWEDDRWEEEMQRRFGEEYYAEVEDMSDEGGDEDQEGDGTATSKKRKKPKKPKWDDDIDVGDIIPGFDEDAMMRGVAGSDSEGEAAVASPGVFGEEALTRAVAWPDSGDEAASAPPKGDEAGDSDADSDRPAKKKRKTTKEAKKDRAASRRKAREELARLEALVDTKMELDNPRALAAASSSSSKAALAPAFRYRETSPNSFGMTARDILLAPSDAALNDFAGLKKLAPFRDAEKKRRDRKKLGKKARLREWRRDVFGREYERTGPTFGFGEKPGGQRAGGKYKDKKEKKKEKKEETEEAVTDGAGDDQALAPASRKREGEDVVEGERKKKKRKRSKGKKEAAVEA